MLEESVSQDFVNLFPVARNQALLVQVDEVALDLLVVGLDAYVASFHQIVSDLVSVDLLERVAESLQLLKLAFTEQLLDNL